MNQAFLEVIQNEQRFLLSGHERPDGDCIGAQVAMAHLLRAIGKDAVICNPDPAPAVFESVLPGESIGAWRGEPGLPEFDVLILLDCAHVSRLGRMRPAIERRAPKILVIDHHVGSEDGDGHECFVDSSAPATGAMILQLYKHFEITVPQQAAHAVFLSIISDTGWFKYSNTTADVFRIAAELVDAGVDASSVYDRLFRQNHPESVDYLASSLGECKLDLDGKFGFVLIGPAAIERASRIGFDLDAVMEPLRSVRGVEVVAMFKENANGVVKLSLRAANDVDVQAIAASLGGGGHRKAAGASLESDLQGALSVVREKVRAALMALDGVVS